MLLMVVYEVATVRFWFLLIDFIIINEASSRKTRPLLSPVVMAKTNLRPNLGLVNPLRNKFACKKNMHNHDAVYSAVFI